MIHVKGPNLHTRRVQVPLECVEDARRCVGYLREKASELGLDRDKIVLAGGGREASRWLRRGASSGGHTAAMAVLGAEEGLGLAGLLLFNPVLDLQFKEAWRERRCCAPNSRRQVSFLRYVARLQRLSPALRGAEALG